MKTIKLLLAIVICAAIMLTLVNAIGAFGTDRVLGLCHTLPSPLGNYAPIVWLSYLMPVIVISVVAFVSGMIFKVNPKTIFWAAIAFVALDWLMVIYWHIYVSLQMPGSYSFSAMAITSVPRIILLMTVPFLSKWLCSKGIKLRENIRKYPPRAELTQDRG